MYVFADGSCSHNDKLGAWACVAVTKARSKILYGVEYPTDIARCEMLPILAGLRWLQKNIPQSYRLPVTVVSDSESTIRMLGGPVVTDPEMPGVLEYYKLAEWFSVRLLWVERNSNAYMAMADAAAYAARTANKKVMAALLETAIPPLEET